MSHHLERRAFLKTLRATFRPAWIGLAMAAYVMLSGTVQAMRQVDPGTTLRIPFEVWIFGSGVLVAVGVNLQQIRQLRGDVAELKSDVKKMGGRQARVDARLGLRVWDVENNRESEE